MNAEMLEQKLDRIITLLTAILQALQPPEPTPPTPHTCKCARKGIPVSNCPICRGSGQG